MEEQEKIDRLTVKKTYYDATKKKFEEMITEAKDAPAVAGLYSTISLLYNELGGLTDVLIENLRDGKKG